MDNFQKIRENVTILQAGEKYLGEFVPHGSSNYRLANDQCPWHGGENSFFLYMDGDNQFAKCFGGTCPHSEEAMDVIEFVRVLKKFETVGEAMHQISRDFGIQLEAPDARYRILTSAAAYYRNLFEFCIEDNQFLRGKNPKAYQVEERGHLESSLKTAGVGWSDGKLYQHLLAEGFNEEDMLNSGLIKRNRAGTHLVDVFPANSFMYPHYWNGSVCRFTMKCMEPGPGGRAKAFQMKKATWLGGIEFYKVGKGEPIAVVEGENDLVSLLDVQWPGTILCTNGQLSKTQIEWIKDNPQDYVTFFDNDEGGEKYQEALWKQEYHGNITRLTQYGLPEGCSDIDEFIQGDGQLQELPVLQMPDDIIEVNIATMTNIREQNRQYFTVRVDKEGDETLTPVSDFVIELMYVKVLGDERSRMIRIHRMDGRRSAPVTVNSEAKVSVRHFKILVANAIDASFIGNETELAAIWQYVYERQNEAVVDVPPYVGAMEDGSGWLFANQFIGPGRDITGDNDNIMWFNDRKSSGISPKSLLAHLSSTKVGGDIPQVQRGEHPERLLSGALESMSAVFKDPGPVLMLLGWLQSCAYSMDLFYQARINYFPFLLLWGRHGKGKSTVVSWALNMYDMSEKGVTTVGQIKSGVGIERKLAYYRGLPFCIDELRADRQATEFYGTWRGWYNRTTRVKGTRKGEEAITVPFNSCLMFSGQDVFTDPAMRSRSIPIKFPVNAGDHEGYMWMQDNYELFPQIGYMWIKEALEANIDEIKEEIITTARRLDSLCGSSVPNRTINNYAIPAFFGEQMARQYFPDYDFMGYINSVMNEEVNEASENDTLNQFWQIISGLQIGERAVINGNHLEERGGQLFVWIPEVCRIVESNRGYSRENFSTTAIKQALKEERYYVGETSRRIGATSAVRRCMVFDVATAPDDVQAIALASRSLM